MQTEELKIRKERLARDFFFIALSLVAAIFLQTPEVSKNLIGYFSGLYYVPAAVAMGFLFSITFTAAISTSVFVLLAESSHNPFLIALLGAFGSILANSIVYKFFKEEIIDDIEVLEPRHAKRVVHKIFHSKLFIGLVPYIAALLLISPLPDELGIMMLAGSNYKYTRFVLISFALHAIGIFLLIILGTLIS